MKSRAFFSGPSGARLAAVLGVSALLRLPGLNRPLLGNFSSLQIIYAMMARNFRDYSRNLFLPRLDEICAGAPCVRLLDLPLHSYGVALLSAASRLPVDMTGRLWSAVFSLLSVALFYDFVRQIWGEKTALASAFFFAFSPLSIIYGQSFQTDATSLFFLIAAIRWILLKERKTAPLLGAALAFALTLLLRIQYVFLFPLFGAFFLTEGGGFVTRAVRFSVFVVISVLPLVLWNLYSYHYLEAHPERVIMSIFHQLNTGTFSSYAPWSFFFLRQITVHLVKLLLNPPGFLFLLAGLLAPPRLKREGILYAWFFLTLLMLDALSKKAVDMNYYIWGLTLPASVFAAKALESLKGVWFKKIPAPGFVFPGLWILVSLSVSVSPAYHTPAGDRGVMEAAAFVRRTVPEGELLIASNGSNSNLLYYTGRRGWAFLITHRARDLSGYASFRLKDAPPDPSRQEYLKVQHDPVLAFEYFRSQGARYFVCSRPEDLNEEPAFGAHLRSHYPVLFESPVFIVFKLF